MTFKRAKKHTPQQIVAMRRAATACAKWKGSCSRVADQSALSVPSPGRDHRRAQTPAVGAHGEGLGSWRLEGKSFSPKNDLVADDRGDSRKLSQS